MNFKQFKWEQNFCKKNNFFKTSLKKFNISYLKLNITIQSLLCFYANFHNALF